MTDTVHINSLSYGNRIYFDVLDVISYLRAEGINQLVINQMVKFEQEQRKELIR